MQAQLLQQIGAGYERKRRKSIFGRQQLLVFKLCAFLCLRLLFRGFS